MHLQRETSCSIVRTTDENAALWCRDDVLPCRTYLRHCALSAQALSSEAHVSFLDNTYLADRKTTVRQHLDANPEILEELPPPHLAERYCGS